MAASAQASEIFLCLNAQGGRGGGSGVWMSIWVDDVDAIDQRGLEQELEVTWPPDDMPWNAREMHVRHPDGHVFESAVKSRRQ